MDEREERKIEGRGKKNGSRENNGRRREREALF